MVAALIAVYAVFSNVVVELIAVFSSVVAEMIDVFAASSSALTPHTGNKEQLKFCRVILGLVEAASRCSTKTETFHRRALNL